ncbi:MAG: gluconokinase [Hamadaea sp.]|nr:gluconokinase [Hamadaea sp.]
MAQARVIVVIGVAGSGKTTIGLALAERLGIEFVDGDGLHPPENVAKMTRGIPLDDADRLPWLERIGDWIDSRLAAGSSGVVACSGLRRAYRQLIGEGRAGVQLVYLRVRREVAEDRVSHRSGHFFGAALLESQFAALEEPEPDEGVLTVNGEFSVPRVVDEIARGLTAA